MLSENDARLYVGCTGNVPDANEDGVEVVGTITDCCCIGGKVGGFILRLKGDAGRDRDTDE